MIHVDCRKKGARIKKILSIVSLSRIKKTLGKTDLQDQFWCPVKRNEEEPENQENWQFKEFKNFLAVASKPSIPQSDNILEIRAPITNVGQDCKIVPVVRIFVAISHSMWPFSSTPYARCKLIFWPRSLFVRMDMWFSELVFTVSLSHFDLIRPWTSGDSPSPYGHDPSLSELKTLLPSMLCFLVSILVSSNMHHVPVHKDIGSHVLLCKSRFDI